MDSGDHWQAVYRTKRPDAVSWHQASPAPSLAALDRIGARPDQSLIDVGGGASNLVDALLDRGWADLTVLDISAAALEATRSRLGEQARQIDWISADLVEWVPERAFDVWHDRAVFHFLTQPEQRIGYLRALEAGTRAGSHLVIATFAIDGPEQCSGLPVCRYDAAGLAAELGPRFQPVEDWSEEHVTPLGASQNFQWAVFRRN